MWRGLLASCVWSHGGRQRVRIYSPVSSAPAAASFALVTADFDGDGHADVATLDIAANAVVILFGNGHGGFESRTFTPGGSSLLAADFDGDERPDLLVFRSGEMQVVSVGQGRALVPGPITSTIEQVGSGQSALGDFDGNGHIDVAVLGRSTLDLYFGNGTGAFDGPHVASLPPTYGATRLDAADFDGDGRAEIAAMAARKHSSFLGNGTPDLAIMTFGGVMTVFLGDGHGVFHSSTTTDNPYAVARLAPLTLDGEPGASSFVTQSYDGAVDLWPNRCPDSDLVLPALLSLSGVGGVRFESQLTLTNRGTAPLALALTYTSALGSGSGTGAFTLPPGQKIFASAFDFLRSTGIPIPAGADGLGTLGILVAIGSPIDVAALVRTTSQAPGAGKGGVAYAGVPHSQAADGAAWIPWLRENSQDRSNVAAVHAGGPSDGPMTLRLTIRSGDPAHPGVAVLEDVTLAPGGFHQWDRVFALSGLHATRGYARVERVSGKARFVAYGIVNDNGTGDGSFVPAVTDQELSVARGALGHGWGRVTDPGRSAHVRDRVAGPLRCLHPRDRLERSRFVPGLGDRTASGRGGEKQPRDRQHRFRSVQLSHRAVRRCERLPEVVPDSRGLGTMDPDRPGSGNGRAFVHRGVRPHLRRPVLPRLRRPQRRRGARSGDRGRQLRPDAELVTSA